MVHIILPFKLPPEAQKLIEPRFIQKMAALFVLDLDHPEIGVETALFGDGLIDVFFSTFHQDHPLAIASHQIETALIAARLTVQRVELDQNRTCSAITALHDKGGDGNQPQTCQIGRNPDISG